MQLPVVGRIKQLPRSVLVLTLVGLLGAGGLAAYQAQTARPSRKQQTEAQTVSAKTQDLEVRIRASGTITPVRGVNISPKNAGRLTQLLVDQGDRVQEGQVIARMEDDAIQAQLAQAKAGLAEATARLLEAQNGSRSEEIAEARARVVSAEATVAEARAALEQSRDERRRNQTLSQEGAISRIAFTQFVTRERQAQSTLEAQLARLNEQRQSLERFQNGSRPETIAAAKAAVDQAQAQIQTVQVQLNDTIIRAPFSGTVTQKYANVGAFVTPTTSASSTASATSSSIVAIASTLEVVAKVPETSINQIRQGQQVEIKPDAYPGKTFRGTVRLIAPEAIVEQGVTSFQVRVALVTGQTELRSGMNTDLLFLGNDLKDAIVVPTVAIVTQKGKPGVLVPDNQQQPQFKPVTTGISVGDQVQVVEGLKPGESVFVYLPKSDRPRGGNRPPER